MSDTPLNSLGFAKSPAETRVVVAMSGGVDSSVAAALLHEQGYDVVGITLQLYDYGDAIAKKGACCAGKDIYDAKRVAEERGFPHYVLNYESNFRQSVIDDFVESYLKGETPIPCVKCNQTVKFHDLLQVARDLNADCMVTGHYVQRLVNESGVSELRRAVDSTKDQSYFLFATTQEQLDFLRFPLGGWTKDVTRQHAERLGLVNADKPDSQDICFVPNGDYASVVKKIAPEAERDGEIVHLDGRVLGTHKGIIHYTVGQRKGLGIGGGFTENNDPLYVVAVDAETARVIVGPKEALARDVVHLRGCNWLGGVGMETIPVEVKLRSMTRAVPAYLTPSVEGAATLRLKDAQYGISPGQAAVCYLDDRVIGGGWIISTELETLPNPVPEPELAPYTKTQAA
ncbi:MAG: tRNA 2-thiouridine(34) synthase MnmA [Pseudobdellovibrionaceae bacterium]|jgi:tRNA-specific 2-thiouridylase|nr:tRNA 2-thiouridine(34) synthase MnmA [Pseudobdellovibrionaceae bacterium]